MLLHCDLVYGAERALPAAFRAARHRAGVRLDAAASAAGYQRAAKLLLLGQPFTAQEAYEAGIVTEVVAQEKLLQHAFQVATALASLPPESIRLTKRLMKSRYAEALAAAIDEETRIFTERLASPEAKEAMSAFLEKRKPDLPLLRNAGNKKSVAAALAGLAQADMYRWIDRETGQVKFSNTRRLGSATR